VRNLGGESNSVKNARRQYLHLASCPSGNGSQTRCIVKNHLEHLPRLAREAEWQREDKEVV
jgi:hypothetical protein